MTARPFCCPGTSHHALSATPSPARIFTLRAVAPEDWAMLCARIAVSLARRLNNGCSAPSARIAAPAKLNTRKATMNPPSQGNQRKRGTRMLDNLGDPLECAQIHFAGPEHWQAVNQADVVRLRNPDLRQSGSHHLLPDLRSGHAVAGYERNQTFSPPLVGHGGDST